MPPRAPKHIGGVGLARSREAFAGRDWLIGPDTVNILLPATLDAFRDHDRVRTTLTENVEEAVSIMDLVRQTGIPFKELTDKLLEDGVKQFADAFVKWLKATDRSGKTLGHDRTDFLRLKLLRNLYKS